MLTWLRIIAAATAVLLVTACSTVRLGYGQAHNALYWWIDGYADLNDAQSSRARQDIDRFMAWHASEELPRYADLLRQWQDIALQDTTAQVTCRQYDALQQAWQRIIARGSPALARLALQLDDAQMAHMQRHLAKSRESFAEDFLKGAPQRRLDRRTERLAERYEILYGDLSSSQVAMVREGLSLSPFDPAATLQERERQAQELIQMIRRWKSLPAGAEREAQATREANAWLMKRLPPSDTTVHPLAEVIRHGCSQYARLHNSTTPQQRQHAVRVLRDYEADLRSLAAQD